MRPEVTLIVVAFHKAAELAALLDSTAAPAVEQVVVNVDNDEAVTSVASERHVALVPLTGNPGYAAGVNRGAAVATAPVIVFSNDDISCESAALRGLAAVVSQGTADVAVPRVVDESGATVRTIQAAPSLGSLTWEWLLMPDRPLPGLSKWLHVEKWRDPTRVERIEAASAVMVAVRGELLRSLPLPEAYFLYWEESEWFTRLERRGSSVVYVPGATIVHAGGRSVVSPAKSALVARNAVRCIYRLDGPRPARAAYFVGVLWQLRLVAIALGRAGLHARGGDARPLLASRLAGLRSSLDAWPETRGDARQ